MGYSKILGAIFIVLGWIATLSAAEIELLDLPGEVDLVSIKGEISEGDSDRFYDLVKERERVTVVLQSPGGLVKEALQIGAEIRMKNFATMVASDGECFSACGLIWVSGARRYMSPTSRLASMPPTGRKTASIARAVLPMPKSDPFLRISGSESKPSASSRLRGRMIS